MDLVCWKSKGNGRRPALRLKEVMFLHVHGRVGVGGGLVLRSPEVELYYAAVSCVCILELARLEKNSRAKSSGSARLDFFWVELSAFRAG